MTRRHPPPPTPARGDFAGNEIRIVVHGTPAPAGSKKGFPIRAKGGRIVGVRVTDDSKRNKPWQAAVRSEAADVVNGSGLLDGPLEVEVTFYMKRPKGHFGTGRNAGVVKASAPSWPAVKPDTGKLVRSIFDALTGVVWRDDAQVVSEIAQKKYGEPERAELVIRKLKGAA